LYWKHTGSPKTKEFKETFSTREILCTIFCDRHGVVLVEFLPQGKINSAVSCETLKLRCAILNNRRRMLSATIFCFTIKFGHTLMLRLKISSPHISGKKWTTPCTPDLAPHDYHLFLHLKKFLGGKRFYDDDDLKDGVQKWLPPQAAAFYDGTQKHVLC